MFSAYCDQTGTRHLMGARSLQGMVNTASGVVFHYRCVCGATGHYDARTGRNGHHAGAAAHIAA